MLYVKQPHTPETVVSPTQEESGLFNSLVCNSFDVTMCRDLFCRAEEVDDIDDSYIVSDDDPRLFQPRYAEESSRHIYTEENVQHPERTNAAF